MRYDIDRKYIAIISQCRHIAAALVPKEMKLILDKRGVVNTNEMRKVLSEMDDFKNETCRIEHFLNGKGHICLFLPKFHPELNPIERVWSQAKR